MIKNDMIRLILSIALGVTTLVFIILDGASGAMILLAIAISIVAAVIFYFVTRPRRPGKCSKCGNWLTRAPNNVNAYCSNCGTTYDI